MSRLFGTDGVRGIAGTELTCELAMRIGRAAAVVLTKHTSHKPKLVIGKDTRISSDMLEAALVAGICSVGADVEILGVIPTPAVAFLVKKYGADAGVMISASHNPVEYNGIKLFNGEGFKLSDALEDEIEALLNGDLAPYLKNGVELGRVRRVKTAASDYVKHLISCMDDNLEGMSVAVDCANGSASVTAEMLFKGLGAKPLIINCEPDGANINDNCGSTHLDTLTAFMKKHRCQLGVAFDGDADRCLAVDEQGNQVDGDKMLAIFSKSMKEQGRLNHDTVVVTVMSNLGFFHFANRESVQAIAANVGDRYVLEEMLKGGYNLGGEQSGHIIFSDYATTGDGQLSAIKLMGVVREYGKKLSVISGVMNRFPQVMINIKANDGKKMLEENDLIRGAIDAATEELGADGRILVRASGTEPLIRVMVEGKELDLANRYALRIANVIKEQLDA
ncbi:MAG: phosphoglucosamine mutase [Oscillospiraceae bacterium]|jgi:phosphoglucosamine mutase